MTPIRVATPGSGKIARDQHLSALTTGQRRTVDPFDD
jgi:hypothetical protein